MIANSTRRSARLAQAEALSPEHKHWLATAGTRLVRETIAFNLRCARERAGISQDALAEHSGIAKRTISRIESAAGDTVMPKLYALALTLGVPVADLVAELSKPRCVRESR